MIALALVLTLQLSEPSARCLIEIGNMTDEAAELTTEEYREFAREKHFRMGEMAREWAIETDDLVRNAAVYDDARRDLHANGLITDAERAADETKLAEVREIVLEGWETVSSAPSCGWFGGLSYIPLVGRLQAGTYQTEEAQ